MEEFGVVWKGMQTSGNELIRISGNLRSMSDSVESVRNNLRGKIVRREQIDRRLSQIGDVIEELNDKMDRYGNKLIDIAAMYSQTEQRIIGAAVEGTAGETAGETNNSGTADETGGSIAWKKWQVSEEGKILGFDSRGEAEGEFIGASYDYKFESGVAWEEVDDGTGNKKKVLKDLTLLSAAVAGEVHVAKGSVSGNIGIVGGEASGTIGKASAEGQVSIGLMEDGKLAPQIDVKAEVEAVAAEGEIKGYVGTENNNIFAKAEGKAGVAKAKAEAGAGVITYEDANGDVQTGVGVKGEVGAEAYLAEGTVSGGISIFGIEISGGITGKAGGAGASAGGHVTSGGVGGSISLGFLIGGEIELNIDWTGFKWGW